MNFGYGIEVKLTDPDNEAFNIKVDDCFIHHLTAGAFYISSSTLTTIDTILVKNTVISNQPQRNAIYLRKPKGKGYDGPSFNCAIIENCLILDAPYAMYIEAPTDGTTPEVLVDHVTVDRCGAGIKSSIPGGNITNSVVYGFDDDNPGYAFRLTGTEDIPTVISDVIYTGDLDFTGTVNATNVEAEAAIFTDRANGDYSLASNSPGYQGAPDGTDLGMIGLEGTPLPPKYDFTVKVEGSGYIKNPYLGTESFYEGSEIKVEIEDDYEDNFLYYYGGTNPDDQLDWRDDKSDKEMRIIITQDTVITAVFKTLDDDQKLTTSVNGHGSVDPAGENMYWLGEIVELTATPDDGYEFVNWTTGVNGDTIDTDAQIEIVMESDTALIANFAVATGIKLNSTVNLNVYPNPTSGAVRVSISDDVVGASTLEVYDITGKVISSIIVENGQKIVDIDLSSVHAGVYFGVLKTANKTQSFKIIKK